jgi:tetratricopeptide (TPR) repeat protein
MATGSCDGRRRALAALVMLAAAGVSMRASAADEATSAAPEEPPAAQAAQAAEDGSPASSRAPDADALKEARRQFEDGQTHYSLGEYEQALACFRRAYELSSASKLLFNIAQAHRLKGDCKQALEIYRHFVRLAPSSPYRGAAEAQIAGLAARCGGSPSATAVAPPEPSAVKTDDAEVSISRLAREATPPQGRWRRPTAVALLAAGVTAGVAAGLVHWWNDNRYDDWSVEDQRLAGPTLPGTSADLWAGQQANNDDLLRSIHRADGVGVGLLGVSAACLLGSAVLGVLLNR